MQTFPSYAKFLKGNYGEEVDYKIHQSEMDNGLRKQRPGRSVSLRTRKGSIRLLGTANKHNFEAWLKQIGGGTQRFKYYDVMQNKELHCRFVNTKWEFSLNGRDTWTVECEMESLDE